MDLQRILKTSRIFYRDHRLPEWRAELPKQARVEGEAAVLEDAGRAGFTMAFAFPPFEVQMANLGTLVEQTARAPAPGLPDNQQYTAEPFLADTWSKEPNGKLLQRRDDLAAREYGPYVLLLNPVPCTNAWGRTGKQVGELFAAKGWQGLTVPEYFVLQRYFAEKHGDHRFYDQGDETNPTHWLWLVDSMTATDCSVAMGNARGINVQACPVNNRESRRAALAGQVVALELQASRSA